MTPAQHLQALQEVRQEIADLERRLSELRPVERYHEAKAKDAEGDHSDDARGRGTQADGRAVAGKSAVSVAKGEFKNEPMKNAAVVIMTRYGVARPMNTRQIADALLAGGYPTKNPAGMRNATFSMLNREAETFQKVGSGKWQLIVRGAKEDKEQATAQ